MWDTTTFVSAVEYAPVRFRLRLERQVTTRLKRKIIGESLRGRQPLITLARNAENISPCLSCLSPETSRPKRYRLALRPLGVILSLALGFNARYSTKTQIIFYYLFFNYQRFLLQYELFFFTHRSSPVKSLLELPL